MLRHQLVAHGAVGVEPLLAGALDAGRVDRRPVFDLRRMDAGQFQRLVMRRRRQRHDQIEIEPFQVFHVLEGHRLVARDIDADLLHDRDRERIEQAFLHAGGADIDRFSEQLLQQAGRHRRAHRVHAAGEQHRLWARTALGLLPPRSALPVQHADQREQPARGVEIDRHLVLEPLHQDVRAVVVDAAPAHVDRLDLVGRRGADGLIVAVADQVVVLDDAAQRRERKQMRHHRRAVLKADVEHQPVAVDAQMQRVGTAVVADRREGVLLEQIVDRDRALVLDVRVGAADRFFVERDGDQALLAAGRRCFRRAHR